MPNGYLRQRRRRQRLLALSLAAGTLGGATAGLLWALPDREYTFAASPGHGRGLSQNGAFDRAVGGNTAETILAHYYPGAALDTVASTPIRVRLMGLDGKTLDVESETGLYVAGRRVVPGQAAHLTPTATGADVTITRGCDGAVLWEGTTDDPYAYPLENGANRPIAEQLELCEGSNYRGVLGVTLDGNESRVINEVDIEDYLRGVVPAEMVPNWADEGGAEALRAQAIAARSYALADQRYSYAQTCDTTDCQAYPGTDREDARTTTAVQSTAGQVLVYDNHILRAEYSAAPDAGTPSIDNLEVGPALSEFQSAPTLVDPTVPTYTDPSTTDPTYTDPSTTDPSYADPTLTDPATPGVATAPTPRDLTEAVTPPLIKALEMLSNAPYFANPVTPGPPLNPGLPGNMASPSTASTPTPPTTSVPLFSGPA
ncbi:SpoIID/LytB domain-containing protein [Nocardia sp. SYP-A9097]|uniref:SpoIID/LytB domain-containing protein n=1 Tax=Nocardia sp. SYP-A9097 TaxID=2663237 RepID=UPI00129BC401|nr:SpoIID/LytB domain-containing protein [Nocardia sp. SYP-A9097]MRH86198.1 SpoIID/LytB domain-containing protein [Nocardia sp. SYP-A9097]